MDELKNHWASFHVWELLMPCENVEMFSTIWRSEEVSPWLCLCLGTTTEPHWRDMTCIWHIWQDFLWKVSIRPRVFLSLLVVVVLSLYHMFWLELHREKRNKKQENKCHWLSLLDRTICNDNRILGEALYGEESLSILIILKENDSVYLGLMMCSVVQVSWSCGGKTRGSRSAWDI